MKNGNKKNVKIIGTPSIHSDLRAHIENRAYDLWIVDGRRDGNDLNHWLQAERELLTNQRFGRLNSWPRQSK